MYYWSKEPNKTVIECDKCGRILKFDDKYFSHGKHYCTPNTLIQCPCGNSTKDIIQSKDSNIVGEYDKNKASELHCPHCGSANIQLMRKKWSLMTGFLTNKVERYCVNCGKKF